MLSVDYGGIGAVGRRGGREKEGREEEEEREGGRGCSSWALCCAGLARTKRCLVGTPKMGQALGSEIKQF